MFVVVWVKRTNFSFLCMCCFLSGPCSMRKRWFSYWSVVSSFCIRALRARTTRCSLMVSLVLNPWHIDNVWYRLLKKWDIGKDDKRLQKINYWLLWLFQNWHVNKIKILFKIFYKNWVGAWGLRFSLYILKTFRLSFWGLVLGRNLLGKPLTVEIWKNV